MRRYAIKFRPTRPRSPHLNGKVERSQKTDKIEFYPLIDLKTDDVKRMVEEWQFDYNWHRPHSSLAGKTLMEKAGELSEITPFHYDVGELYDPHKERFQERNYKLEMQARKLKPY